MFRPWFLGFGLVLFAGGPVSGGDEKPPSNPDGYVKVEIRGQLIWPSSKGTTSGIVVVRVTKNQDTLARSSTDWQVVLPTDKATHEMAKKLNGKTVVIKGRLETVIDYPGGIGPLVVHAIDLEAEPAHK